MITALESLYRMLPSDERFSLSTPDTLIFGRDTVGQTGEHTAPHGDVALVVTDPGIQKAGLLDAVHASLEHAGVAVEVYNGVRPDPTVAMARECAETAVDVGADAIVGVGGGSALDVAKAAAVISTADVPIEELFGRDNVAVAGLPTILLPTTAGTGSEVSPACVLTDAAGEKRGIVDAALFASAAIVDPDLTLGLPMAQTRSTGLDAFAHAIGSYLSTDANTFADTLCVRAMALIESSLRDATFHGAQAPEARVNMSLAATMAMVGRVHGGKAAIHSIAYGIQAMYGVPHGKAIAMVLPESIEYNLPACASKLGQLGSAVYDATGNTREQADAVVRGVRALRRDVGLDVSLRSVGATDGDLPELAELAVQSERHLEANPRPVEPADAKAIFEQIY